MNHIQNDTGRIFYRMSGETNHRSIVMIHGLAGDSRFFHNQMKYFSNNYKVISIDLPGHGRSNNFPEYTLKSYCSSIEEVIRNENLEKYTLLGHSMGASICLEHYLQNKDKIRSMILVSTAAILPVDNNLIENAENDFHNFLNNLLSIIFSKKAGIFILAARKNMTSFEKEVMISDLKICSKMNYESVLEQIDIPVMLIANKQDKMIPSYLTEKMHKKIRGSQLVIFDENGHIPFFEQHESFNRAAELFLNEKL